MRKSIKLAVVTAAIAGMGLTACGDKKESATTDSTTTTKAAAPLGKVGVILPESKTSARWEGQDRKYLDEYFKAANVTVDIQNAEGDATKMATIADQMITSGVKVLMIVNVDSGSGAAIQKKASEAGVKTIDYDRLTLGGSAEAYISFDNVKVGELQGQGLVKCLTDKNVTKPQIIQLHGAATDNNATLFKQGYQSILKPKFESGDYLDKGEQAVPGWVNSTGGTLFEQMLTANNGKVDGVLAANDGLAGAVIAILKNNNLQVPVTGQDATAQGLQNVLAGDQCMTVYKAAKTQAKAAVDAAVALLEGKAIDTKGATVRDDEGKRDVPSVLSTPVAIYKDNVKVVTDDGYVEVKDLCTADYTALCDAAGIK